MTKKQEQMEKREEKKNRERKEEGWFTSLDSQINITSLCAVCMLA